MHLRKFYWVFASTLLAGVAAYCQPVVAVNAGQKLLIGKNIAYFVDSTRSLSIRDAIGHAYTPVNSEILNLGNISDAVWMRFSVESKTEEQLYLEIMAPLLDELELYKMVNGSPVQLFKGGFNAPFGNRMVLSENWLFSLDLKKETCTYYIRGHSGFPFQVPVVLSAKDKFVESNQLYYIFWGLYIGTMLFAFIYNLFIYTSVRERKYFYYILYIIGSATFYLALEGFSFMLFWPNHPIFNSYIGMIICITNIIITLFAMNFLQVSKKEKGQYYFARGLIYAFALLLVVNLAGAHSAANALAQLVSLVACIYFIYAGFKSAKRGVNDARYFLIAWTIFLFFVFIFILTLNNVIVSNFFTTHCIFIGHMTEVLLLSFALADRINSLKKQNEKFQRELMKSQIEIQEQTLRHIGHELHDNLGQVASLIKINLNTLNLADADKAYEKVQHTLDLTRQLIADIKSLSISLGSDRITQTGLAQAIATETERLNKTGQFAANYQLEGQLPEIDQDKSVILYRMAQEVLNNMVKHSKAKQIDIVLNVQEKIFTLVFTDNGLGFNLDEKINSGGAGLHNLHNRARLINAQLIIRSAPGHGTIVTIELPL